MIDPEPQPGDGPEYHADHAFWAARQSEEPVNEDVASLAQGLAELGENIEPMFEQARGIRLRMESEGWSPTAAETAALTWLCGAMSMFWTAAAAQVAKR